MVALEALLSLFPGASAALGLGEGRGVARAPALGQAVPGRRAVGTEVVLPPPRDRRHHALHLANTPQPHTKKSRFFLPCLLMHSTSFCRDSDPRDVPAENTSCTALPRQNWWTECPSDFFFQSQKENQKTAYFQRAIRLNMSHLIAIEALCIAHIRLGAVANHMPSLATIIAHLRQR